MKTSPGRSVTELRRGLQHSSMVNIRAAVRSSVSTLTVEQSASLHERYGLSTPEAEEEERQLYALALELAIMKRRR